MYIKRSIIFISILLILCGVFGGYFIPQVTLKSDNTYKGKEVFNTEQEYDSFKQSLIDYNAHWESSGQGNTYIQALSSNPPIIVNFNILVKRDITFPYGKETKNAILNTILASCVFACIILLLYMIFSWNVDKVWWLFKKEVRLSDK